MSLNTSALNTAPVNGVVAASGGGGTVYSETLDDALTVYDNGGRLLTAQRDAVSGLSLLDLFSKTLTLGGTLYSKTLGDVMVVSDQLLRYAYRNRLSSDALSVSDQRLRYAFRFRLANDQLVASDSLIKALVTSAISRTLSDVIVVSDAGSDFEWIVRASDYAALTDAFSKSTTSGATVYSRTQTDNLSIYDILDSWYRVLSVVMTDEFSLTDSGREIERIVRVTDAFPVYDSFSKALSGGTILTKTQSDGISVSDQLLKFRILNRAVSDGCAVADGVLRALLRYRVAGDQLALTDSITAQNLSVKSRVSSDNISLSDQLVRGVVSIVFSDDSIAMNDAAVKWLFRLRRTDDLLLLLDSYSSTVAGSGAVFEQVRTDAVVMSDSAFRWLVRGRGRSDQVSIADQLLRAVSRFRESIDTVELDDGVTRFRLLARRLSDSIGVSDELLRQYLPFVEYVYDVRARFGVAPSGIVFDTEDGAKFMGSATDIIFGGYN